MKLLPGSFSFLLFLLLLVELPVLSTSHPTPMRVHKDGFTRLLQQMHQLLSLVQGVLSQLDTQRPFEENLPSLPTINFRPQDLAAVEVNTTLSQLSSGLHSFKLHFDWLLYWQNQLGSPSVDKTKEIANHIQLINLLVHRQMPELPAQNSTLSFPPPTSTWDMVQKSAVAHNKLQRFCDWYLRALRVLIHKLNSKGQ